MIGIGSQIGWKRIQALVSMIGIGSQIGWKRIQVLVFMIGGVISFVVFNV